MPFNNSPRPEIEKTFADAKPMPLWLDDPAAPAPADPLTGPVKTDLAIVGAGFTGLWAALLAKDADPAREVVVLEGGTAASGASGRNGGFVSASLTHGFDNGLARWPNELKKLVALGQANLDAIEATVKRLNIDCDFIRSGELSAATEAYQVEELRAAPEHTAPYGEHTAWLEPEALRGRVNSPLYLGALYNARDNAMVNPARLAWGLRQACLAAGVRVYENSPVTGLVANGNTIGLRTPRGNAQARRVALATNAFPPLLKRLSYYIVPVYDYVLATEPLSPAQRAAIGWAGREGLSDCGNQFHYSQMTADGRILWGGYDAVYHWNNGFGPRLETNPEAWARLAEHFFQTFPQLAGVRFTHKWGGAIDTCSRFSAFWGTAHGGRVAYAVGYTGLGVGASRFGAQVMLDLLDGRQTERTALEMARSKPLPFPPEPARSLGIRLTQWSLARADLNAGKRNVWLRLLDALGMGFDS